MAVYQAENIADLVTTTLRNLGSPKVTDISSAVQNHVAFKKLIRKGKMEVFDDGYGIQFNVLAGQSTNARMVSLGESDNLAIIDGMTQANTVWRNAQTGYSIIGQVATMNSGKSRITDYVKQQRHMAMVAMAELFETQFWGAPSATDTKTALGLPYWVTKNATKGFNGGTLSGYSTVAGLNTTTYAQWNNFTAGYTNVTRDDFLRTAREACTRTQFMPPVDSGLPTAQKGGPEYGFYTNYSTLQAMEEAAESQNENNGTDLASMDGKVLFRSLPVEWIPWLDRDTTNPFYGLDWSWFYPVVLRGWWFKETNIINTPGQHTVSSHFLDCTFNFLAKNRRPHLVLSNGTTYPS